MNLLFLGLFTAGVVASLPWALHWMRRRRTRREWLALSSKLELSLSSGTHQRLLAGRHRGHPMEVRLTPHGTSQVRIPLAAPLPTGLHLSRQKAGAMRLPRRGMQDIQVGDEALDKAFIVQGKNPAAVIRLLREPGIRDALLALQADSPRAVLTETEVVVPLGSPLQEESCRRALRSVAHLTSALEEATARHQTLAATAREQVRREHPPVTNTRPASEALAATEPPSEEDRKLAAIREEFARRLRLHNWLSTYPTVVGFSLCFLSTFLVNSVEAILGLPVFYLVLIGGGLFIGGLLGHHHSSRRILLCPACGLDVVEMDPEKQEYGKMDWDGVTVTYTLSTDICPNCGIRLR